MKKIINTPAEEVHRNNLPEFPTIGFCMKNQKGWLQYQPEHKGYQILAVDDVYSGVGTGDGWTKKRMNLKNSLDFLFDHCCKVYLFNSDKELFKWLSE